MISLAIDATNISTGGGFNHLFQLISAARPQESNFKIVHLWTSSQVAKRLPKREWLVIHSPRWCDAGLIRRMWGQQFQLPNLISQAGCDVLFAPGGTVPARGRLPMVTMSQNMLPFEPDRAALFGRWSWMRLKMRLLRFSQGRSFGRAQGVIFLTHYARETIKKALSGFRVPTAVISHGIEHRFLMPPRKKCCNQMSPYHPFRLLYVSIQLPYKHHLEVMMAVSKLRDQGLPVMLQIVGDNFSVYGNTVRSKRLELDPDQAFIQDLGHVDFQNLHELYWQADAFIFASSCENLPNILIEAMAAGLPIASSHAGPMPEVLGDAGVYFHPESVESIMSAINKLVSDPVLRENLARRACERAQAYSWDRCARETLNFVANVASQVK